MIELDRDFLYQLEMCKTTIDIEGLIDDYDNDEIMKLLQEQYKQILRFNKNEKIDNIKKILIYKYRNYCEHAEEEG